MARKDISKPQNELTATEYQLLRNSVFSKLIRKMETIKELSPSAQALKNSKFNGLAVHAGFSWVSNLSVEEIAEMDFADHSEVGLARASVRTPLFINSENAPKWIREIIRWQNETALSKLAPEDQISLGIPFSKMAESKSLQAIEFLKLHWPEMHELILSMISHIVWVESKGFLSCSVPKAHGLVLISPKSDWQLAHYLEALVHECAHLELLIRQSLSPLVTNPTDLARSPLRQDPRPIDGVLHAVFVLARTTEALRLLEAHELGAKEMRIQYEANFREGLDTLTSAAKWTPAGLEIFEDLQSQLCPGIVN